MSPDLEELAREAQETAVEDGEPYVGQDYGPELPPLRLVKYRAPDGRIMEKPVSEEAWQRIEALRKQGYAFIATTSRKAKRARQADLKRERRRRLRQSRKSAT